MPAAVNESGALIDPPLTCPSFRLFSSAVVSAADPAPVSTERLTLLSLPDFVFTMEKASDTAS